MFPPTSTLRPEAVSIRPTSVVVVDFPLVPVIAITRPRIQRQASSSSPMISTPPARAARKAGCSSGTPGLATIRSADASVSGRCPPSSSVTPLRSSRSASSNVSCTSVSVTAAPRARSSSAAATPLRAAPTTTTRRPRTEKSLSPTPSPQLQRRQAEEREDHRHDQKSGDHLRLAPPHQFEVMVERRHLEHSLARELERRDLDDHRGRLGDEHAADDYEQQLLLDEGGYRGEGAAQRQRADIAHENFGGIRVVPKEAEARPHQRAAEDRELRGRREAYEEQVVRKYGVTGNVGQRGERRGRHPERADREAVEAVGQVYGVRPRHEHERGEQQIPPPQVRDQVLEEGKDQTRVVERRILLGEQNDRETDAQRDEELSSDLVARAQSVMRSTRDLQIVVGEADRAKSQRREHRN